MRGSNLTLECELKIGENHLLICLAKPLTKGMISEDGVISLAEVVLLFAGKVKTRLVWKAGFKSSFLAINSFGPKKK